MLARLVPCNLGCCLPSYMGCSPLCLSTLPGPGPCPPPLNGVPPFPLPCYRTELSSVLCLSVSTLNQGSAEKLSAYHLYPGPSPLSESPLDLRGKVVVTVPLQSPTRQTPAWHKASSATFLPTCGITNVGSTCFRGQPQKCSVYTHSRPWLPHQHCRIEGTAHSSGKGPLFPHNQNQST